ncbi:MAG: response regulator transcription factor [Bacteroidetes bacterium]|jgi:DNA-binding NarL/FixJ family response regulator|nr:response regulator transcription factor [Bacteroidota bacterium]MBK9400131.1 response regulator transcription factor [Bacteroidota bacterium]MBL0098185.1 response regulator transcription factor [Bacteroidota bacterium]
MESEYNFTKRQLQVLREISKGKQRKTIASKLKISIYTVDDHIHNLHVKTKTHLWGELIVFAKDYISK